MIQVNVKNLSLAVPHILSLHSYFLLPCLLPHLAFPSERAAWGIFLYAPDNGTHVCPLTLQVFKEEQYLRDAYRCADVVWQYGLLKKGYGLCHGAAGNAYAFLALYNLTQDVKYLYRACKVGARLCLGKLLLGRLKGPRSLRVSSFTLYP